MSIWKRGGAVVASAAVVLTGMSISAPAAQAVGDLKVVLQAQKEVPAQLASKGKINLSYLQVNGTLIQSGEFVKTVKPWTTTKPTVQFRMRTVRCDAGNTKFQATGLGSGTYKSKVIQPTGQGNIGGFLNKLTFKIPSKYMNGYLNGRYAIFEARVKSVPDYSLRPVFSNWVELDASNPCDRP